MTDFVTISPKRMAMRRFLSHKAAVVSCVLLALMVLAVILSPLTARYGVNEQVRKPPNTFLPPQKLAWFGTDEIGRDMYSRLIYGIKISLIIGLFSALIIVVLFVCLCVWLWAHNLMRM